MKTIPGIASLVSLRARAITLAAALAVCPAGAGLAAQTLGRYGITLSDAAGVFVGQAEEIVYAGATKIGKGDPAWEDGDKLSQLLWDLKPLAWAGLGVEFAPRDPWTRSGVVAGTRARFGMPGRVGVMEDRDWQDDDDPTQLTNYSHHDADVTGALLWDVWIGFSWAAAPTLAVRFWGEYSYERFYWSASGGYRQYAEAVTGQTNQYKPWSDSITRISITGPVITYAQAWYRYSLGVAVDMKALPRLVVGWSFGVTPPLYFGDGTVRFGSGAICEDNHLRRSLRFTDYVLAGVSFTAGLRLAYAIAERQTVTLSAAYRYSTGYRGLTATVTNGEASNAGEVTWTRDNAGGAAIQYLDAGLAFQVRLF